MYDDFMQDDMVLPDFDDINDLQLFDSAFTIDCPFEDLDAISVSFD